MQLSPYADKVKKCTFKNSSKKMRIMQRKPGSV